MVQESQYGSGALKNALSMLLDDDERRSEIERNVKSFAFENANEVIYSEIMQALKK